MKKTGEVILVGAGPGDPELITVKGINALKNADAVLFDALVDEKLLEHCSLACEKIFVGKRAGNHHASQDEINTQLLDLAQQGKVVVRLKGGDPFIFGRGFEELLFLKSNNIPVSIVPGISSAQAVPALAGIPLTHRGTSSDFAVASGHRTTEDLAKLPWSAYSALNTIVFLMGVKNLPIIVESLCVAGKPAETSVAVIQDGTSPKQKVVIGTLATIVEDTRKAKINPPAVIVIGDVVGLGVSKN